jgi:hypothetical protein
MSSKRPPMYLAEIVSPEEEPVKRIQHTLTSAELLHLKATPIQFLPAPGPGKFYLIHTTAAIFTHHTVAYSLNGNALIAPFDSYSTSFYFNLAGLIDMARFLMGAAIGGISQSLGGATAIQAGPTGILRRKVAVAKTSDFYSLKNRSFFFTLVHAWTSALNDTERTDWLALGGSRSVIDVFGNPVPLNGLGTFIRYNLPLLQTGLPFNHTPPTDFTATTLLSFTIAAHSSTQTIKLTALTPNISAIETLIIACSVTLSAGYTSTKHRPLILHRAAGPVTLPIDFSARWLERGGSLLSGTALTAYLKVMNQNSGHYGPRLDQLVAVT